MAAGLRDGRVGDEGFESVGDLLSQFSKERREEEQGGWGSERLFFFSARTTLRKAACGVAVTLLFRPDRLARAVSHHYFMLSSPREQQEALPHAS